MVKVCVLISGKRKSGKDFVATKIVEELKKRNTVGVCSLSHSLKEEFAGIHDLDYMQLIGSGEYKERYRKEMIEWGEEVRNKDNAYFCRKALAECSGVDIIVVTDCRRVSDVRFFEALGKCVKVRVDCDIKTRIARGYSFVVGVDDAESECGLDDLLHDVVIDNSGTDSWKGDVERVGVIATSQLVTV